MAINSGKIMFSLELAGANELYFVNSINKLNFRNEFSVFPFLGFFLIFYSFP